MVSVIACLALGFVLLASAASKLIDPVGSRAALATYGVRSPHARARHLGER